MTAAPLNQTYDWIVVGAGITGAALAYELAAQKFSVLLLEQQADLRAGATAYSYGGVPYWAGTTPLLQQLGREGLERHRQLPEELDAPTEFREIDLLLTVAPGGDPVAIADNYAACAIPPRWVSATEAKALEPLLDRDAIAGALVARHGHIHPLLTAKAYIQACQRLGGELAIAKVTDFIATESGRIQGAIARPAGSSATVTYYSKNVAVAAGGYSRQLLQAAGIPLPLYFTHAEMIETPPVSLELRTLVMPASMGRLAMEQQTTTPDQEAFWQRAEAGPTATVLEAGAIQFQDGSLRLGQISRVHPNPTAIADPAESEAALRDRIGQILPDLKSLSGTWHHCLVAFSQDSLPLIGPIPDIKGIHLFSSFSSPLVLVPPLAQRFARNAVGFTDDLLPQLSPARFLQDNAL